MNQVFRVHFLLHDDGEAQTLQMNQKSNENHSAEFQRNTTCEAFIVII